MILKHISETRLNELMETIKPLVRFKGANLDPEILIDLRQDDMGLLYNIEPVDGRQTSFLWEAVPMKFAGFIKRFYACVTLHTWAYYGFFKPSVAEVLAEVQDIPDVVNRAIGFEIISDGNPRSIIGQYHIATAIFYESCE